MAFKTKTSVTKPAGKPPVARFRDGLITVSIFEHEGDKGTYYSCSFQRRYRDADGTWKSSSSYHVPDLLVLAKLADLAHTKILDAHSDQESDPEADDTEIAA